MNRFLLLFVILGLLGCKKEEASEEQSLCGQLDTFDQVQISAITQFTGANPSFDYLGFNLSATGPNNQEIQLQTMWALSDTSMILNAYNSEFNGSVLFPSYPTCPTQTWHNIETGSLILKDSTFIFDSIGQTYVKHLIYLRLENATYLNGSGNPSSIGTLVLDNLDFVHLY